MPSLLAVILQPILGIIWFLLFHFRNILISLLYSYSQTSDAILNKMTTFYLFLILPKIFHIMLDFYVRKSSIKLMCTEYLLKFSHERMLSFVKCLFCINCNNHMIIVLYLAKFYLFIELYILQYSRILVLNLIMVYGAPNLPLSLYYRKMS